MRKSAKSKVTSKSIPRQTAGETVPAPGGPVIVGIAGSAGSLVALQTFFDALPSDSGMAFVVVTHLSPEHESHMASLLQTHTQMPVTQVTRALPVRANQVYVIPPSKNISITDSHVEVSEFSEPRSRRSPIDFFFRTLARSHRDAVAIILSGGGTDGSVGIKDVKEEGGLLMVQDPEEAEYASMPNAAIATNLVDVVLPTRELAAKLMEFARQLPPSPREGEALDDHEWSIVQAILAQVQRKTKHDFSQYKRSTVLRRVRRRMLLNNQETLESYLEFLRTQPSEAFALLNDLLIGVTNFFRDHEASAALKKEVIPLLFRGKDAGEPVRAWSAGCASGEEVYSLAILFMEVASELGESRMIQIFGSDIDEESLTRARAGLYPAAIEADVSPERLEKFFTRRGDHYQVGRELRDMILFTPHSVLRDPPFSRQDLVICRNLLIYLQRDMQEYVLDIFHYSLRAGGYLFLGGSETTTGQERYFQTVDKHQHLYRALPSNPDQPNFPQLPSPEATNRAQTMPLRKYAARQASEPLMLEEMHRRSLEAFGPPSILVRGDNTILHVSESAGRYLNQPKGAITNELFRLIRPELQQELRATLFRAWDRNEGTVSPPVILELNREPRRLLLAVYPRSGPAQPGQPPEKQALVVFLEDAAVPASEAGVVEGYDLTQAMAHNTQLEAEVRQVREQLEGTQEEYDSSTEEMRAANEELQSINEEYHLTTEELETSKEELEALNEELQTVNNELKVKLDEILRAQHDLENVMGAMEIATLFLDRQLRIQRFTPALEQFFGILKSDIGRPIDDLRQKLRIYEQLTNDARRVLDSLTVVDREIQAETGLWYLIRLRPYRTVEDSIEGVVITFVDVSALKHAETALKELNQTLEERVSLRTKELEDANRRLDQTNSLFSTLFHVNPIPTSLTRMQDSMILDINEAYARFFGVKREEVVGKTTQETNLPLQGKQRAEIMTWLRRDGSIHDLQLELPHGRETRTVLASLQHLAVDGKDAVLTTFYDLTERVQSEQQIRTLAANLTAAEQKERQRIAKILHDDLQQRLFAVKMQLSFMQQNYQQGNLEQAKNDSENLENWLSDAIETTRRLSVDMSPVVLHGSPLSEALGWLAEEMRERYALQVHVRAAENLPKLEDHLRTLVFESVREALFNVVKHGEVQQAEVTLEQKDGSVQVEVVDHGKGFDAEKVLANPKGVHGLMDIRNRLNLLGGGIRIVSHPGDGTTVLIQVPA